VSRLGRALRGGDTFRCCGKTVCHCHVSDNAAEREVVINGRGKEINPKKFRSGWGAGAFKK
jgi:hypothetical protein